MLKWKGIIITQSICASMTINAIDARDESRTKNQGVTWPGLIYRQTSNIGRTFGGNKLVDHSDVVRVSPVGAASTTSPFPT